MRSISKPMMSARSGTTLSILVQLQPQHHLERCAKLFFYEPLEQNFASLANSIPHALHNIGNLLIMK